MSAERTTKCALRSDKNWSYSLPIKRINPNYNKVVDPRHIGLSNAVSNIISIRLNAQTLPRAFLFTEVHNFYKFITTPLSRVYDTFTDVFNIRCCRFMHGNFLYDFVFYDVKKFVRYFVGFLRFRSSGLVRHWDDDILSKVWHKEVGERNWRIQLFNSMLTLAWGLLKLLPKNLKQTLT